MTDCDQCLPNGYSGVVFRYSVRGGEGTGKPTGMGETGCLRTGDSTTSLEYKEFCDILTEFLESLPSGISEVPTQKGFRKIPKNHPLTNEDCPICLCKYEDGTYRRDLRCGHTFHKKCVDRWFRHLRKFEKDPTCPICRSKKI